MEESKVYYVIAYYCFTRIENPHQEVARQLEFIKAREMSSRIYISEEGINAQLSGWAPHAEEYIAWMRADSRFSGIDFKIHTWHENVFPRSTVKVRRQLVALDSPADLSQTGERVAPQRWKEMLNERDENTLLLDVRNDYEWEIGHFEGAELPVLEQFREFPSYAKRLKEKCDPKATRVMMYCTGGIRCELFSALLKQEGFENVYQLQGGVIGYGLNEGSEHWKGKLFVFDDRLAIPIAEEEPAEVIATCLHCQVACDVYYNCANVDCNELFICCSKCAEKQQGCCSNECLSAPRVRPFQKSERPKPFRKWCDKPSLNRSLA